MSRRRPDLPDDWSRDETIVALDACPSRQVWSTNPVVREVADLLGRSPGAVSHKFGNIWSLWTDEKRGLENVGGNTRSVYLEFRGHPEGLHAEALRLRRMYLAKDPTPRVDFIVESTMEDVRRKLRRIRKLGREEGIDPKHLVTSARPGTIHGVVAALLPTLFASPWATRLVLEAAKEVFADGIVQESLGAVWLFQGKKAKAVRESLIHNLPGFHPDELRLAELRDLAVAIGYTGPLNDGDPSGYASRRVRKMSPSRRRELVQRVLHLDSSGCCPRCSLMLAHVAEKTHRRMRGR